MKAKAKDRAVEESRKARPIDMKTPGRKRARKEEKRAKKAHKKERRMLAAAAAADILRTPADGEPIVLAPKRAEPPPQAPGSGSAKADETDPRPKPDAAPPPPNGVDLERLSANLGTLIAQSGKTLALYLKPYETGEGKPPLALEATEALRAIAPVAEHWMSDPARTLEAQSALTGSFVALWAQTLQRFSGLDAAPVAPPDPADKRFAAPEWRENPFFDFLRQAHAIGAQWADGLVGKAEPLDAHAREKARFYLRQIAAALSPSNFLATNPELLRETFTSSGENLIRGATLLAEDVTAGNGKLKIRQSDASKFTLGVNMAVTPGKVVFRNELIELIQYAPTTETVLKRPLLIVPPWINKFYILDLNAEKSFVRWAVAQGLTVFLVSWVNPDARHRDKDFFAYAKEGVLAALDAIETATGETDVTAIGYCVGGTLLAATLAHMAQAGDRRIGSATLFAAQTDFSDAGELKIFVDEKQIGQLETQMAETGYLDGAMMANAFNMLRPTDLIWSYVVNNYVRGKKPAAFDLLTWNADSTRMTAANHSYYLRNCYLENRLAKGEMVMGNRRLSLGDITIPVYNLATREDHIAPAKSVFTGAKLFGGEMRYVLAGSGHIAGVINPPMKPKYQYWTGPQPTGSFEEWLQQVTEHKGSWWPDWLEWIVAQAPGRVDAASREPGKGALPALCDAPGTYVRAS